MPDVLLLLTSDNYSSKSPIHTSKQAHTYTHTLIVPRSLTSWGGGGDWFEMFPSISHITYPNLSSTIITLWYLSLGAILLGRFLHLIAFSLPDTHPLHRLSFATKVPGFPISRSLYLLKLLSSMILSPLWLTNFYSTFRSLRSLP